VETGKEGGFLAEIPRQRHDLYIDRDGEQGSRDVAGAVAAPVIDVYEFQVQAAFDLQVACDLGNALMQAGQAFGLIEKGYDDGQSRGGGQCPRTCTRFDRSRRHPWLTCRSHFQAIYTAPGRRCRAPAYRDMV